MTISIINTILCAIVFVVGISTHVKHKNPTPLLIALAFGAYGITHILAILGLKVRLSNLIVIIRTLGYLLVILALLVKKKPETNTPK